MSQGSEGVYTLFCCCYQGTQLYFIHMHPDANYWACLGHVCKVHMNYEIQNNVQISGVVVHLYFTFTWGFCQNRERTFLNCLCRIGSKSRLFLPYTCFVLPLLSMHQCIALPFITLEALGPVSFCVDWTVLENFFSVWWIIFRWHF